MLLKKKKKSSKGKKERSAHTINFGDIQLWLGWSRLPIFARKCSKLHNSSGKWDGKKTSCLNLCQGLNSNLTGLCEREKEKVKPRHRAWDWVSCLYQCLFKWNTGIPSLTVLWHLTPSLWEIELDTATSTVASALEGFQRKRQRQRGWREVSDYWASDMTTHSTRTLKEVHLEAGCGRTDKCSATNGWNQGSSVPVRECAVSVKWSEWEESKDANIDLKSYSYYYVRALRVVPYGNLNSVYPGWTLFD